MKVNNDRGGPVSAILKTACLLGISALTVARAGAAIVETDDSQGYYGAYTVDTTNDFILGLSPTSSVGNFNQEDSTGLPALTDGAFGATTDQNPRPYSATGGDGGGTQVTYNLVGSPTGYDVSKIISYSGWDNNRVDQAYTVSYSTVSNPFNFIPIYTVNQYPNGNNGTNRSQVILTDNSSSGLLTDSLSNSVSGLAAIRFDFGAVPYGYTGYRELEVIGTATAALSVPEPASLSLLAVGAVAFLPRRGR